MVNRNEIHVPGSTKATNVASVLVVTNLVNIEAMKFGGLLFMNHPI